jgi:hypothetical protein
MKTFLTMVLLAVASMLLIPSLASAKSGSKAPAGYEGTPSKCWPNGKAYSTRACCIARGVARGGSRGGVENFCIQHGFTK